MPIGCELGTDDLLKFSEMPADAGDPTSSAVDEAVGGKGSGIAHMEVSEIS